jgi:hypothetical protein
MNEDEEYKQASREVHRTSRVTRTELLPHKLRCLPSPSSLLSTDMGFFVDLTNPQLPCELEQLANYCQPSDK